MGRTKRNRKRKQKNNTCLEIDSTVVSLKQWMVKNKWQNSSNLKLYEFPTTGRGLLTTTKLLQNDTLITVPSNIIISFDTLCKNDKFMSIMRPCQEEKLKIHDMLALFLMVEKHKEETSEWRFYINSLPQVEPSLPWLKPASELQLYPDDLKQLCEKCKFNFEESWQRLKQSINANWICLCCKKPGVDCVFSYSLFTWAYVLVNTRAVYVHPAKFMGENSLKNTFLSDEPSMALCPYLDMFNHSSSAQTKAEFIEQGDNKFYELITLSEFKKYNQVFISYGCHDNLKLLTEYGFFVSNNLHDFVTFSSDNILSVLKLKMSKQQFNFLQQHDFISKEDLYISEMGYSYKMQGFLFVALNGELKNYSAYVFSNCYPEQFNSSLENLLNNFLNFKHKEFCDDLRKYEKKSQNQDFLIIDFLKNRIQYLEHLINTVKITY